MYGATKRRELEEEFRRPDNGRKAILSLATETPAQKRQAHQQVEEAYTQYVAAWKAKDIDALRKLIADDYQVMNPDSELSTKEKELASAQSDPAFDGMKVTEMHTRVWANTAVVSGLITASGKGANGTPFNYQGRFLAVLVKRGGAWKLVATQSGTIKPKGG